MLRAIADRLVYASIPVNVNSLNCTVIGSSGIFRDRSRTRQLWWGEAPERDKPPIYSRLAAGSV